MREISQTKQWACFLLLLILLVVNPVTASEQVSIYELAQKIAKQTNRTFIFSPRVKKSRKVDIFLGSKFAEDTWNELFNTILNVNGYTAIEQKNTVLIVRKRRAKQLWKNLNTPLFKADQ